MPKSTLLQIGLIVLAAYTIYIVCRLGYLYYKARKERKRRYVTSVEENSECFVPDYNSTLMSYRWFTGNDHCIKRLSFDSLTDSDCIHVTGKMSKSDYASFGCMLTEYMGDRKMMPLCDNVRILKEGKFSIFISKSILVSSITRINTNEDIMQDCIVSKKMMIPVWDPENDHTSKYMFYFDLLGGDVSSLSVKKYSYDNLEFNTHMMAFGGDRDARVSESQVLYREDVKKTIGSSLLNSRNMITETFKPKIINHANSVDVVNSKMKDALLEVIPDGHVLSNFHSDVVRFATEGVIGTIKIFFVNHKEAGTGYYSRISVIDSEGREIDYITPNDDNKLDNYIHLTEIDIPDDKLYQLVESIYGGRDGSHVAPSPHDVYSMIPVRTESILSGKSMEEM